MHLLTLLNPMYQMNCGCTSQMIGIVHMPKTRTLHQRGKRRTNLQKESTYHFDSQFAEHERILDSHIAPPSKRFLQLTRQVVFYNFHPKHETTSHGLTHVEFLFPFQQTDL